ncbi:serine hydrolase [Cryobacterium sp. SO2]|uniref:serine hydrolase domain-containing protein n=1 Tax=Cryobacterium sp. SO2 TaxID=1897060 RepID=UPI00223CB2C8|nr:serine hydrolase domain-containing protein [Cryobacterium sp. SO2]WEO77429.1 serine hydrolase [Cryobacterium sp. SO2]
MGLAATLLVILVLPLSACADAAVPQPIGPDQASGTLAPDIVDALDAALADGIALAGASGAIAGVWVPGAGQWLASPGSVGTAVDPGTGRPGGGGVLSTEMSFRIGTQTTAMTCTVLLRLVDEHRVGLDDPVTQYLTRQPGIEGITLRQLCQHTSGLGQPQLDSQFVNNPTRTWPPLELVSGGLGSARVGAPGKAWSRSEPGIQLLGMALEAATGDDWPTLYNRYVFGPLGLHATSYPGPQELDVPGAHPHGWAAALTGAGTPDCARMLDVTRLSTSMAGVAGGVVSTLGDLRTWSQALATGSLLATDTARQQWTTVAETGAPDWRGYGLGAEQLGPVRGSTGQIPGYLSATLSDPDSGLTVVVMVNDSSAGEDFALDLARRLVAIAAQTPVSDGRTAADLELPWTAVDAAAAMRADAVCPAGAADQAAPAG